MKNQHKIKLAARENSSTPFHFGRNDMSGGGTVQPHRLYSGRGGRQIAAPTGSLESGSGQPNRLYSGRGGWIFPHSVFQKRIRSSPIIVNCPLSIVNFPAVPFGFAGWDAFFTIVF